MKLEDGSPTLLSDITLWQTMTDVAIIFTNDTVVGAAGRMGTLHSPTYRALTGLDRSEVRIDVGSQLCFS